MPRCSFLPRRGLGVEGEGQVGAPPPPPLPAEDPPFIEPPFWCDFGYNIKLGKGVSALRLACSAAHAARKAAATAWQATPSASWRACWRLSTAVPLVPPPAGLSKLQLCVAGLRRDPSRRPGAVRPCSAGGPPRQPPQPCLMLEEPPVHVLLPPGAAQARTCLWGPFVFHCAPPPPAPLPACSLVGPSPPASAHAQRTPPTPADIPCGPPHRPR